MADYRTSPFSLRVEKPWGHELIFTEPGLGWTGKLLYVRAGQRLSLQYHDEKEETVCLLDGEAAIWLQGAEGGEVRRIPMRPHAGYTIRRGQLHRIEAVTDAVVVEASEPERGNTVRVQDDHGRGVETESDRAAERTQHIA